MNIFMISYRTKQQKMKIHRPPPPCVCVWVCVPKKKKKKDQAGRGGGPAGQEEAGLAGERVLPDNGNGLDVRVYPPVG